MQSLKEGKPNFILIQYYSRIFILRYIFFNLSMSKFVCAVSNYEFGKIKDHIDNRTAVWQGRKKNLSGNSKS